jgi:hypothetical protein
MALVLFHLHQENEKAVRYFFFRLVSRLKSIADCVLHDGMERDGTVIRLVLRGKSHSSAPDRRWKAIFAFLAYRNRTPDREKSSSHCRIYSEEEELSARRMKSAS